MLDLAERADRSEAFDTVWIGDSILAKARLEAVALLGALAARTRRVRLGVGCMASFPHRHPVLLAHQWASLDVISRGRMLLAACIGGPDRQGPSFVLEHRAMGIRSSERVARLEEGIAALRALWAEGPATHTGRFYRFENVDLRPRPVQRPCPIWIASNPTSATYKHGAPGGNAERMMRRVGRLADGWMTNRMPPAIFRELWAMVAASAQEAGRDPSTFGSCLYHNININPDRAAAYEETKRFLDLYYYTDFPKPFVDSWTAYGSADECVEQLSGYFDAGVRQITLRLCSWDQRRQYEQLVENVLPAFGITAVA
jgi:alkanesulfonate monooxygenase SsuD/methylene tetrahydromethanopterin reductase-like flavin-dependent oxidoreductase (luciferase family)